MSNKKHNPKPSTSNLQPSTSYRLRVSEQYRTVCEKTGEFFREVVKFGALLNEVEDFIGLSQGRDGEGLKAWLAENCPEVNYKTAWSYKAMATKCAKMIGGGVQALACLQGREEVVEPGTGETVDVDSEFVEKRDALFAEADSRRKLEQMWFQFCAATKAKAGRPAGTGHALAPKSTLECAVLAVSPILDCLLKHRGAVFAAYKVLPDDKLADLAATLDEHSTAIKDEQRRRK